MDAQKKCPQKTKNEIFDFNLFIPKKEFLWNSSRFHYWLPRQQQMWKKDF